MTKLQQPLQPDFTLPDANLRALWKHHVCSVGIQIREVIATVKVGTKEITNRPLALIVSPAEVRSLFVYSGPKHLYILSTSISFRSFDQAFSYFT